MISTALAPQLSSDQRRAGSIATVTHALHDGYTDMIYILLPLWQAEFGLDYAALGVLRGVFVGAMATLQIPVGLLSERFGAATVLALGTALAGFGYCLAGASTGFAMLLGALFLGGLGASSQHPIASALVARAFAGRRSLKALGTYNFAGDIGKMTLPATLSLMLLAMAWRPALAILGSLGFLLAAVIFLVTPRFDRDAPVEPSVKIDTVRRQSRQPFAFPLLLALGIIDSATRMGFLLFLPFVLKDKGASVQTIGLALTLIFAGGAAGKLACAFIGARIGAIGTVWLTEGLTAAGIMALVPLPLGAALLLASGHRRCAQWHFLGAVRFGARSGGAALARPRPEHFLYRHHRFRRDRAGAVRPGRRRARDLDGAHAGRRLRAHHPADRGPVTRRSDARVRFRDGVSASTLRQRNTGVSAFSDRFRARPAPIGGNCGQTGTLNAQGRWP